MQKGFTSIIFIVLILLAAITGGYFLSKNNFLKPNQNPSQPASVTSNLKTEEAKGEISWLEKPIQISPNEPLSVFPKVVPSPDPQNGGLITKLPTFYKVGTWTSGEYKGVDVIDVQNTYVGQASDYHEIKRITTKDNKVVLFNGGMELLDPNVKESDVILDQRSLPSLLPERAGLDKYKIDYQGKGISFNIYSSGNFFTNNNYTFLTNFYNGQKLYRKNQSGNIISWSSLEDPYQATELDSSALYARDDQAGFISEDLNGPTKNWIIKPDLLSDLSSESKSLDAIGYSDFFGIDCKHIPTEELAGDSGFNPTDLELVMTSGDYSYYRPTNSSQLLKNVYDKIKTAQRPDSSLKAPTFERFVNSIPILIGKDNFGTYHITYRWRDYPGREGGCGKPVIYLYPKTDTTVNVRFADEMALSASEPRYGNSWKVLAKPNGQLTDLKTSLTYPNLYWEGASINQLPQKDKGFLVKKEDIKNFLETSLKQFGLNTQEKQDFIDFWLPKLQEKPFYKISFYTTDEINTAIPLNINPRPDTIFRILMKYQGLNKPVSINPQVLPKPFNRDGFTVVEWGGIFSN